jgi:hypothetical protein
MCVYRVRVAGVCVWVKGSHDKASLTMQLSASCSSSDSSDSEAEAESRRRDAPRKSASPLPAEATAVVPGPAASPPVRLSGDSKRDDAMGESSEGRNSSKRGAIRDEKEKRMVRRDPQAEARARGKTRTAVIDPTSTRSGTIPFPPPILFCLRRYSLLLLLHPPLHTDASYRHQPPLSVLVGWTL